METAIDYFEEIALDMPEFPEWLCCPYCGDEGTEQMLKNSGHSCCREFLQEFEGEWYYEKHTC
ncbi:MAG: hypothetical protein PHV82_17500 [Victivallaceae bacterium]|nr:hypothetical protein [Victivallaceae bacterium]